jgi:hypothetical protein
MTTKTLPDQTRFTLPETPGVLRARIATRLELAKDMDPESWGYVKSLQRVRELEIQLAKLEGGR